MVAAEAVPFIKTGGLADVVGSLPEALARQNVDVRIALPHYPAIDVAKFPVRTIGTSVVHFDGTERAATVYRALSPGLPSGAPASGAASPAAPEVPVYLIDAPRYFQRIRLYGYQDDVLRFGFFSRVCLELPLLLDWQPDIIHCHDWHTGFLPVFVRERPDIPSATAAAKTVFTIHNLAYQGEAHRNCLPRLGLDWSLFNYHQLEFYGKLNSLKGGLVFADMVTTVSQAYADEIQTKAYGAGLEDVLKERADSLRGILNGIDYSEWNPCHDEHLAQPFGPDNFAGKAVCKRDLLRSVGLPESDRVPVLGMVSRLSAQKGLDLTAEAVEALVAMGCYFVLLGSGEEQYARLFRQLQQRFPQSIACSLGKFNNELAHKVYAGCDMFLMPSHYEPCGLAQMISLAYGTIPVVRATGGLADTVHEFDVRTGQGNGFVFKEYTATALTAAVARAVETYQSPAWPQLIRNAFACDFSWHTSARQYIQLYREMLA